MFTIRQHEGTWELVDGSGAVLSAHDDYADALGILSDLLGAQQLAAMDAGGGDGLLPESWVSPVAFVSEQIAERDFRETNWIWRDPGDSLLPLMLHTETDMGHFGAQLAGFITSISESDGTGSMAGRFYDTDEGRTARDLLLDGRRFGVSVDPGERTEIEWRCTELDDDGFCMAEEMAFLTYDVIGLTMTPFPGFARAHIVLGDAASMEETPAEDSEPVEAAAAVVALAAEPCEECAEQAAAAAAARGTSVGRTGAMTAAGGPRRPPASWFADPGFTRLTAPRYEDDGRCYGHLAPWGQCHTGSARGTCTTTPRSLSGYASFLTGYVVCDDGTEVSVGQLTVGGGHADDRLSYIGAIEHYDNVAAAFADVTVGEDAHGVWFAGALRPDVTEGQLRTVRACPPSGDWREIGRGLELVAACSVISQGFPIARVASSGRVLALVAAGQPVIAALSQDPTEDRLARMERQLAEMRALAAAPARARLRQVAADRLRSA